MSRLRAQPCIQGCRCPGSEHSPTFRDADVPAPGQGSDTMFSSEQRLSKWRNPLYLSFSSSRNSSGSWQWMKYFHNPMFLLKNESQHIQGHVLCHEVPAQPTVGFWDTPSPEQSLRWVLQRTGHSSQHCFCPQKADTNSL